MATCNHTLVFPHEHNDLLSAVHSLNVRSKVDSKLRQLLQGASDIVNELADTLDGSDRTDAGICEDVMELAERHVGQHRRSVVAEMVLLATIQLGHLLVHVQEKPEVWSSSSAGTSTVAAGYGVGLVAATVAATARNADDVVFLGLRGIRVVSRLAVQLSRVTRNIEDSPHSDWARVVTGIKLSDIEKQLDRLNDKLRPLQQAYVGQIFPDHIVIHGAPSTLNALSLEADLAGAFSDTASPYRCVLFNPNVPCVDIDKVMNSFPRTDDLVLMRPLYSAHDPVELASDRVFDEFLRSAVTDISQKPVQMLELAQMLAVRFQKTSTSEVVLTTLGSTWDFSSLERVLAEHVQEVRVEDFRVTPDGLGCGDDFEKIAPDAIAVVGMSGRFPQSDTLDELWQILQAGSTTHQEIPADRFCIDDFYDPSRKTHNAVLARHGCFIKKPGDFDHRLFNISPREAMQMDPVQRMLLMTTYEALEMAGYSESSDADSAPPKIATYFGQTVDDWKTVNMQQGIDTHFLPAVNRGFAPGRLCHYFRWAGGFYSIDTGCSSSATGICIARDALAAGTCDAAVVGGGTLLASPEWFAGLSQGGFLSPTGACKTYSETADGYCRGEGVAVVVLKRLRDAIRAKDNVLAVISGASRNTNAGEASITHPGQHAQESLYRRVMRQAAVHPHDVEVVEMHGTGTQAGDRVETQAIHNVFVAAKMEGSQRTTPLTVGAIKASLGHSEAAAGVVSLIKAILMLQHNSVARQAGQPIKLNPYLSAFFESSMRLANNQSWPRKGSTPRYVFINNFDAAGGNVSMLIQDPPTLALQQAPAQADSRSAHVVAISGRTPTALAANKDRLRKYLTCNPDTSLASWAYTSTARRMHQSCREAYVATSVADVLRQLKQPSCESAISNVAPASSIMFAFTGQGSQYVGMGRTLYRTSLSFRQLLDSYQSICDAQELGCNFLSAILDEEDPPSKDTKMAERNMQVALIALEIALAKYWQQLGIQPKVVIGHSLGEFAAMCIAGVLSVNDALVLVHKRATLITTRIPPSEAAMLAVGLPASTVQWRIRDSAATGSCEICCVNGPSSTVVGGPVAAIQALESNFKLENVVCTRLSTKYAFHTKHMDPLLDELEEAASHIRFHPPDIPIASSLLGRVVHSKEKDIFCANYVRRHSREKVAFFDAVRACDLEGVLPDQSVVVEIGPHPVCIGLIASAFDKDKKKLCTVASLRRKRDDWETVSQSLAAAYKAQIPLSWTAFHRDHLEQVQLIADLPTYAFENKTFWHSYQTEATSKSTAQPAAPSAAPSLPYTSLHTLERLDQEGSTVHASFTADTAEPRLGQLIGGHIVDGVAICPASVFIDMAYSATHYLDTHGHSHQRSSVSSYSLTDLKMQSPLVVRPGDDTAPKVQVDAKLDLPTGVVKITFKSGKDGQGPIVEHGSCSIVLAQPDGPTLQTWSQMKTLVKAKMQSLDTAVRPKDAYAFDRKLFYKSFSEIVDYASPYHAVEEAAIDTAFNDASVIFQLPHGQDASTFTCNPFAVDAMIHVPGFLLNADVHKSKEVVHIANHIGALRVFGDLSLSKPSRAYATVRERDVVSGTSLCDVYVVDDQSRLLALCTDIRFQKLDRAFFSLLTGSTRTKTSKTSKPQMRAKDPGSPASTATSTTESEVLPLSDQLLSEVSLRSGIGMDEIQKSPDMDFADMGIDSQMSIQILADFHKSTAIELPAAFFTNFPTPAAVRAELGLEALDSDSGSDCEAKVALPLVPKGRGSKRRSDEQRPSEQLLGLVVKALDLEADPAPSATFEEVGMDSMLSIKIIAAFQDETGIELPAAFFSEYRTVAAAKEELDGAEQIASELKQESSAAKTPEPDAVSATASSRQQKLDEAVSRPVLIQGKSRSRDPPLFMTTDGSGTVESYIHLSALRNARRIYALESPFLLSTDRDDFSIQEMASIFIRSIRKIQPHGPYFIGGWSAGSIYAYEVAHRLATQGETIQALLILDMRAPSLIPTSIVTPEFVDKLGTFEGINRARDLPQDLSAQEKKHLMATCRALSQYDAPEFPAGRQPRQSTVVWARLGLDARVDAPRAAMRRPEIDMGKPLDQISLDEYEHYFNSWFYGRREDFGTNGWEDLLGESVSVHDVDGDHFSMMTPPLSGAVGKIVSDAIAKAANEE